MKLKYLIFTLLFTAGWQVLPSQGAVSLSSLTTPTLQTLISMGSTPVTVGPYQFSNFNFVDASSGTSRTAAQVQVMSFTTDGYGLQFVTNWFAADGNLLDDVISYDVTAAGASTSIGQINLLSNGTAPVPAPGTFVSSTLISQLPGGATASPVLSTYNDGFTSPVDTTKPDVNYVSASLLPENQLHIIDTLTAVSSAPTSTATGGLATASVLQNAFVPVPEPTRMGWMVLLITGLIGTFSRPRRHARPQ